MAEPRPLKAGFCLWRWLMVVVAAGGAVDPPHPAGGFIREKTVIGNRKVSFRILKAAVSLVRCLGIYH